MSSLSLGRGKPGVKGRACQSRHHTKALGAFVWSVRGSGRLRRGGDDGFIVGRADFGVADDVEGAVFADFRFAGDQQRAVKA
jgi:hypothetical protein